MAFPHTLRRLRKAAKMSQEQLALACGWSGQSTIANYESLRPGAREPRVSEVVTIAGALGVPVSALFDEAPRASQHGRLTGRILRNAIALVRGALKANGITRFDVLEDADEVAQAMTFLAAKGLESASTVTPANVLDFMAYRTGVANERTGRDGPADGHVGSKGQAKVQRVKARKRA